MISKNNQHDLEYYASQMKKPVWKFMFINGLAWAIPVMVIMIPLNYFMADTPVDLNLGNVLMQIAIWIVGGFLYAWLIRIFFARKFRLMNKKLQLKENGS